MPTWVIHQNYGASVQHQTHWFPNHTTGQAINSWERTNCNLEARQLNMGTPTQQTGKPAGGKVCLGCALRPRGV